MQCRFSFLAMVHQLLSVGGVSAWSSLAAVGNRTIVLLQVGFYLEISYHARFWSVLAGVWYNRFNSPIKPKATYVQVADGGLPTCDWRVVNQIIS